MLKLNAARMFVVFACSLSISLGILFTSIPNADCGSIKVKNMSIDQLSSMLKGKSKASVLKLIGPPDRKEKVMGNECWIYGTTYTERDKVVVFDGDTVMVVTFY